MASPLIGAALAGSAFGSLVFTTLTYSLRDLSRVRLSDALEKRGRAKWIGPTLDNVNDLAFVTAVLRLLFNTAILLCSLELAESAWGADRALSYTVAIVIGTVVSLVASVMLPSAISRNFGAVIVASLIRPLHFLRWLLWPIAKLMHLLDRAVVRAAGTSTIPHAEKIGQEIQEEILSVVEEGEKEGVVDEEEREMILSVISFRDTTAGQIMTPRPEIVAVSSLATLPEIKVALEESGHSRIPVYDDSLDQIVGVLYARDLLKHLGKSLESFNIKSAMRPALYVPETKPLRDLLNDFRLQKVHIAIVLDEYGGTAGLVTIEDVLEELVGDISDEHEPVGPAMFRRIDEQTFEADARMYVGQFNRLTGLELPEDAGYDTLGGFISTTVGRIPEAGTRFDYNGGTFTVLEAEPQRVIRAKVELKSLAEETPEAEPVTVTAEKTPERVAG
jgi:CBS domain containing-hemolysin-like protein